MQDDVAQVGSFRAFFGQRQRAFCSVDTDKPTVGISRREGQDVSTRGRTDFEQTKMLGRFGAHAEKHAERPEMIGVRLDEWQRFVEVIFDRRARRVAVFHGARTLAEP